MDINLWVLGGRLTRDPKNNTKEGSKFTTTVFDAAHNERIKVGGEYKDKPLYFRVFAYGSVADNCLQYLSKGSHVQVVGKGGKMEWDKDGIKQSTMTINATQVIFLDKKPKAEEVEAPF